MKILQGISVKKKLVGSAVVIALATVGVTTAMSNPQSGGADTSPLVQEVQHQGEVLNNHEDRITNTEKDVSDLQNKTSTSPSSDRAVVRNVTTPSANPASDPVFTPAPAPVPQPSQPVTVVGAGLAIDHTGTNSCKLTYSDGSTGSAAATGEAITNPDGSQSYDGHCRDYLGQVKV